jgi:hypothetical protein
MATVALEVCRYPFWEVFEASPVCTLEQSWQSSLAVIHVDDRAPVCPLPQTYGSTVGGTCGKSYGLPLSSTSRSEARIFCCSMLGASGSKRPSFCAFFHARTLSVRCSYSAAGISYFSTDDRSVKSVRAAGGRVSTT